MNTWEKKQIVAAIDFGTTFSGYVISLFRDHNLQSDNKIRMLTSLWHSGSMSTEKTPTVLLLKPDKTFHSFGYKAEKEYAHLCENEKNGGWYYFRNFKMKLYGDKKSNPIYLDSKILDEEGKEMLALDVFVHAIKYLTQQIGDMVDEKLPSQAPEICYILTCPAIWSEQSKLFMKTAAVNAGIPDDRIKIALEPECASVYIHSEDIQDVKHHLSCYLIVDIGGGTLDIAAHFINAKNQIEEIISPDGGPWGGNSVNVKFEQCLVSISGGEAIQTLKNKHMDDYLELTRMFENKKCAFENEDPVRLHVPSTLKDIHKKLNVETLDTSLNHHPLSHSMSCKSDKLAISKEQFVKFHEESVNNIVKKIHEVLRDIGKPIPFIFCVGGYSGSAVVKERLKAEFTTDKTKIVFPTDAVSAIMKGAVILARRDDIVASRISRFTIGLDWNVKFDPAKHPTAKREVTDTEVLCNDVFRLIVHKGQKLQTGKPVHELKSYVKTKTQTDMQFPFYRSTITKDPTFVDDRGCYWMGTMVVPLPDTRRGIDRSVDLKVYIDQILHAEAVDESGNEYQVKLNMEETRV